jgi:hypothetical protein
MTTDNWTPPKRGFQTRRKAQMTDDILARARSKSSYLKGSSAECLIDELAVEVERLRSALQEIASYYANGAVRLNSDVDIPEIARAALERKP